MNFKMILMSALLLFTTVFSKSAVSVPSLKQASIPCSSPFLGTIKFTGDDYAELFTCGSNLYRSNYDVQTFTPGYTCSDIFLKVTNIRLSSAFAMVIRSFSGSKYVTATTPSSSSLFVRVTYDNIDGCIADATQCSKIHWVTPTVVYSLFNEGPFAVLMAENAFPLGVQNGHMKPRTYGVWIKNPICS